MAGKGERGGNIFQFLKIVLGSFQVFCVQKSVQDGQVVADIVAESSGLLIAHLCFGNVGFLRLGSLG